MVNPMDDGELKTPFSYPGGKSKVASKIINHFPPHSAYIEPFGGSATVLCQKPQSDTEVYNDFNDDVVRFFQVARERPDELREYLERMPYSRTLHQDCLNRWFDENERPDDPVQHAAEFMYIRCTNYGSMFRRAGFNASPTTNGAGRLQSYAERVDLIAERFREVIIECQDWQDIIRKYDGPQSLFYCDPPYHNIDDDGFYAGEPTDFDHGELAGELVNLEGDAIVSYSDLPPAFRRDEYWVLEYNHRWSIAMGSSDDGSEVTERLVTTFDPDDTATMAGAGQTTLDEVTD